MSMRFAAVFGTWLSLAACTCRTEKEKGHDLVEKKLDLVEGAAEALKSRGNEVGRQAAQGVGETLKGLGSGVKDVMAPPVAVELPPELVTDGIKVVRANAKLSGAGGQVEVTLAGQKSLSGGLALTALGADGGEAGRAVAFDHRELTFEPPLGLSFAFPESVRLSDVKAFRLQVLPPKRLEVGAGLSEVTVNQLSLQGTEARFYAVLEKGFSGTLQLRAYDAAGKEISRVAQLQEVTLPKDSAQFFSFFFDTPDTLGKTARLELRGVPPAKKKAAP